jgi:hypothetical protein
MCLVNAQEIKADVSDLWIPGLVGCLHRRVIEHHVPCIWLTECHCNPIHLVQEPAISVVLHHSLETKSFPLSEPVGLFGISLVLDIMPAAPNSLDHPGGMGELQAAEEH